MIPMSRSELSSRIYGNAQYVSHQNQHWHIVTTQVNWVKHHEHRWVSLGSSPINREKLFFDESTFLIKALKEKSLALSQGQPGIQVLKIICNIINELTKAPNEHFMKTEENIDKALIDLIPKLYAQQNQTVCLHMDDFINAKLLVCRHKALLSCTLLRHLVEQGILPFGTVRQFRATLPSGSGHTWSVYRDFSSGHLWICDPRNRMVADLNVDFPKLAAVYSPFVLLNMKLRLDEQDVLLPLQEQIKQFASIPFTIALTSHLYNNYISFTFAANNHSLASLAYALNQQGISLTQFYNTLHVAIDENPNLFRLDVNRLIIDFQLKEVASMRHATLSPSSPTVLFAASNISVTSTSASKFRFDNLDWEEFLAKDTLPKEAEFFTKNKVYGRFNYR